MFGALVVSISSINTSNPISFQVFNNTRESDLKSLQGRSHSRVLCFRVGYAGRRQRICFQREGLRLASTKKFVSSSLVWSSRNVRIRKMGTQRSDSSGSSSTEESDRRHHHSHSHRHKHNRDRSRDRDRHHLKSKRKRRHSDSSDYTTDSSSSSAYSSDSYSDRSPKRRRRRDVTSSSDSDSDASSRQNKRRRKDKPRKSKEKSKSRSHKHKHGKPKSKDKEEEESNGPVQLSKYLGRDKEQNVRRSAVSGKKIQLKVEKTKEDKLAESNRNELLKFLNASYD